MSKGKHQSPPKQHHLSSEEFEQLQDRVKKGELTDKDKKLILGVLAFNKWMHERLGRAKLTIKRLRQLFGFKNESRDKKKTSKDDEEPEADSGDNNNDGQNTDVNNDLSESDTTGGNDTAPSNNMIASPNWNENANHGRLGVDAYPGCSTLAVPITNTILQSGYCPACAASDTQARVYPVKPTVLVFLEGQPLITGQRVSLEKVRCGVCQTYFAAPLPAEFIDRPKYSYNAATSIAIHHYYAGQPFYRIERLQAAQGVPMPDATQYDLMAALYESCVSPVVSVLRFQAANGDAQFFDDTTGRIIEQITANKNANSRSDKASVHTTALISIYEGYRIYLFDTNTKTAGKQFAEVLTNRETDKSFITMSDALPSNFPYLEESLLARWIITLCLSHSRRRFVELLGDEPDEDINFVLDQIGQVYANEKHCKTQQLDDDKRLEYHQAHSAHVMEALRVWLNNLLLYKKVEPNSRLGESIVYMLKRWEWLTQFLRVAGAALDNNICEQAIKVAIMYRKNALFYRTFYGATVGDAIMSLLHTAAYAGINIFEYLNALQLYQKAVRDSPEHWLPWNYQESVQALAQPSPEQEAVVCAKR